MFTAIVVKPQKRLVDPGIIRTVSNSHSIADGFYGKLQGTLNCKGGSDFSGELFQKVSTQALPHGTVHVPIRPLSTVYAKKVPGITYAAIRPLPPPHL